MSYSDHYRQSERRETTVATILDNLSKVIVLLLLLLVLTMAICFEFFDNFLFSWPCLTLQPKGLGSEAEPTNQALTSVTSLCKCWQGEGEQK